MELEATTDTVKIPVAIVVPEISPVVALSVRPVGRTPEAMAQDVSDR